MKKKKKMCVNVTSTHFMLFPNIIQTHSSTPSILGKVKVITLLSPKLP